MTAPVRFCSQCGTGVAADTRFCSSCGADLTGGTSVDGLVDAPRTLEAELEDQLRKALVGEYDIAGLLGKGGMAYVYRAHEMMLDREVAIKVMPPDIAMGHGMVERFKREAKTAAKLDHPNIIPIYRIGEFGRTVYFAMKYVVGRGLDEVLVDQGSLPHSVVAAVMQQSCSALAYAHRAGVIHRDIKPSNIMIDQGGWVVVMDFGIAKAGGSSTLTATGAAIGTPHYMSPEQCTGAAVTSQSDQYSLGIMAYQMLTGQLPFDGESLPEILTKHFFESPPPLEDIVPDCPFRVRNAVNRSLEKKPEDRFPTLEAFVEEIASEGVGPNVARQLKKLGSSQNRISLPVPTSPIPQGKPSALAMDAATTPMPQQRDQVTPTGLDQSNALTTPMPATRPQPEDAADRDTTTHAPPQEEEGGKRKSGLAVAVGTLLVLAATATFFVLGGPARFFSPNNSGSQEPVAAANPGGADEAATGTPGQSPGLDSSAATQARNDSISSANNTRENSRTTPAPPPVEEPVTPTPPTTGAFTLTGQPSGSTVRVDGNRVRNWTNLSLSNGRHRITVDANGYDRFSQTVTIRGGRTARLDASGMRRTPAPVAVAPPAAPQHAACSLTLADAAAMANSQGKAALMIQNCVPGLYVVFGRGTRIEDALLPAGARIRRLSLRAAGYSDSPRLDTLLTVGEVLVLSGALTPAGQ